MKRNLGKNEASHIGKKNSVIMMVSIFAITLFIGTAIQPAIASPNNEIRLESEENEDECTLCQSRGKSVKINSDSSCKTCLCVARVAVKNSMSYTKSKISEHIKDNNGNVYDGLFGDIVLWLFEGIVMEINISDLIKDFDAEELNKKINHYVITYVGPQGHSVTKIFVALRAISIGLRAYLISLCANEKQILPISAKLMQLFTQVIPDFLIKMILLPLK